MPSILAPSSRTIPPFSKSSPQRNYPSPQYIAMLSTFPATTAVATGIFLY
jgi:hypothetical protein